MGAVSFFNARPLIWGLDDQREVYLERKAPSALAGAIDRGELDVGLVPSVDYQASQRDWVALPVGAIGSAGEVLTVRVFSSEPLERVEQIACDLDSHTSVVLCQVVWHLRYHRALRVVPLDGDGAAATAVLLIGDKVLDQLEGGSGQLHDRPYQLDLGGAWAELTGLPFVYAFWAGPARSDMDQLVEILRQAYQGGMGQLEEIVQRFAPQHGFEEEVARRYLRENIRFGFGSAEQQGLRRFYELAYELGLIEANRPLRIYPHSPRNMPTAAV